MDISKKFNKNICFFSLKTCQPDEGWQNSRYVRPTSPHPMTRICPFSRITLTHFGIHGVRNVSFAWAKAQFMPSLHDGSVHRFVFQVRHSCFLWPFWPHRKHVISRRESISSMSVDLCLTTCKMCDQSGSGRNSHLISLRVSLEGNAQSLSTKDGERDMLNQLLIICVLSQNLKKYLISTKLFHSVSAVSVLSLFSPLPERFVLASTMSLRTVRSSLSKSWKLWCGKKSLSWSDIVSCRVSR